MLVTFVSIKHPSVRIHHKAMYDTKEGWTMWLQKKQALDSGLLPFI
ncbi:hypothetical protein AB4340_02235 [Vibrio breoganii]|nr:hypothetical protein [Vibrio breoganii]